jgi:cytochrome c2
MFKDAGFREAKTGANLRYFCLPGVIQPQKTPSARFVVFSFYSSQLVGDLKKIPYLLVPFYPLTKPTTMKKIFKVLVITIIVIVILTGITAAFVSLRNIPKYPAEKKDITVEITPARVEQGVKLASMLCRNCHYNDNTGKFTGRALTEVSQFGNLYSRNITQDKDAGIGSWTDGELIYFIRTGIKKDGQYVPPYMPKLIHISDEDLYSIIAFLRSDNQWVQADNTRQPDCQPSFFTKFLVTIGAFKPFPYPTQKIEAPDTTDKVKWGKYIALYQMECFSCHSQDFAKNDYFNPEKSPGFFGGGNTMYQLNGEEIKTLNITMDAENGIGKWREPDFENAVRFGKVPGGQPALRYPMIPYTNLTSAEVSAIYAYLNTIPVINRKVERKFTE